MVLCFFTNTHNKVKRCLILILLAWLGSRYIFWKTTNFKSKYVCFLTHQNMHDNMSQGQHPYVMYKRQKRILHARWAFSELICTCACRVHEIRVFNVIQGCLFYSFTMVNTYFYEISRVFFGQ